MAILNFILLLTLAFVIFASMFAVEGLKCLMCEGQDPKCKSTTSDHECKVEDPICLMAIFKGKADTEITRFCIEKPPQYSLGCTVVTSEPEMSISNCFCDTDNCKPESTPPTGLLKKSAGLTLTPSILVTSLSIIVSIIAAAFYEIQ